MKHESTPTSRRAKIGGTEVRRAAARAFTLVEMIAVMIILGVLAAAVVPRITGTASRQAEVDSKNVQRLLSIAAERSSLWTQPVAIDFADDRLQLFSPRGGDSAATGTATVVPVRWAPDLLVEPVVLARAKVRRATLDGQPLKTESFRVTFSPSQPRPTLELEVGIPSQPDVWTITLRPEATSATRDSLVAGAARTNLDPTIIDLDDTGKGTSKW